MGNKSSKLSFYASALVLLVLIVGLAMPVQTVWATPATSIIYDAISNPLPPNVASLGFEATSTSQFGDYIHLGGTDRLLKTVTVTMSDWALYSDYSSDIRYSGDNVNWTHSITLNIYNVITGTPNTVGPLLATVTQVSTIPWRPAADPTCPGGTAWRAGDSQCYNGYAFNLTFDLSSLNVTLPDDVIVGVAYNTGNYGAAPIGSNGPYNSLNVGIPTGQTASVGSDDNVDNVFWDTIYPGYTAGLKEDTGWTPTGTVSIQITAAPVLPDCTGTSDCYVDAVNGNDANGGASFADAKKTIQAGVDAVGVGGTVHAAAGTYTENVLVNKAVTLVGAGADTIVKPAVSNPNPCTGSSLCGGTASNVFLVQANNVVIHDLTVDGDNPALTSTYNRGGANLDARNGIIKNTDATYNSLEVYNVTVKNIYLRGIYSTGGSFNFHNNTVTNVQGDGYSIAMFAWYGPGTMANNTVSYANDAISANHSNGIQFLDNIVTHSSSGVHTDNSGDGGGVADLIQGNNVECTGTSGAYGIWVFVPYIAPTVNNNTVTNCDYGLSAWGTGAAVTTQFTNNTVTGNLATGGVGAYITTDMAYYGYSDVNVNFSGNVITNYEKGVFLDANMQTWEPDPYVAKTINSTFHSNQISGNTSGADMGTTGTYIADFKNNWWGSASGPSGAGPGTGDSVSANIVFDPWLCDGTDTQPNVIGFQPNSATSPCVVVVPSPAIALDKQEPVIANANSPLTYTYLVSNSGNVLLSNVGVSDNKCAHVNYNSGDNGNNLLDPGETWTFTCTYSPSFSSKQLTNTAKASGKYNTQTVSATDTATLTPFQLQKSLYLYWDESSSKRNNSVLYTAPDNTQFTVKVSKGVDLVGTYTISQNNPLKLWLSNGEYTFEEISLPTGYLAVDASFDYSTSDGHGFHYSYKDHGFHDDGKHMTTWSLKNVVVYNLAIDKNGPATGHKGKTVTYNYTVTNSGPASIMPKVSDDKCSNVTYVSGDTNHNKRVDTGETWTFKCDYKVNGNVGNQITNIATVTDAQQPKSSDLGGDINVNNNKDTWTLTVIK